MQSQFIGVVLLPEVAVVFFFFSSLEKRGVEAQVPLTCGKMPQAVFWSHLCSQPFIPVLFGSELLISAF